MYMQPYTPRTVPLLPTRLLPRPIQVAKDAAACQRWRPGKRRRLQAGSMSGLRRMAESSDAVDMIALETYLLSGSCRGERV